MDVVPGFTETVGTGVPWSKTREAHKSTTNRTLSKTGQLQRFAFIVCSSHRLQMRVQRGLLRAATPCLYPFSLLSAQVKLCKAQVIIGENGQLKLQCKESPYCFRAIPPDHSLQGQIQREHTALEPHPGPLTPGSNTATCVNG